MERLKNSFLNSPVLKEHISFLYLNGSMYNKFNSNLLFHGCVPMNEDGTFREVEMLGKTVKGKELFDYAETIARIAFAQRKNKTKSKEVEDLMWYLWCSANSPLFGKDKAATFERYFTERPGCADCPDRRPKFIVESRYDKYLVLFLLFAHAIIACSVI